MRIVINVGLWRTGTTSLAEAQRRQRNVIRKPIDADTATMKRTLLDPRAAVAEWWSAQDRLADVPEGSYLTDGFWPLLPFLPDDTLRGLDVELWCTERDVDEIVRSELQHYARWQLATRMGLDFQQRADLGTLLRKRAVAHANRVKNFPARGVPVRILGRADLGKTRINANPPLPLEGILLTFRLTPRTTTTTTDHAEATTRHVLGRVDRLLTSLEADDLCRYLLVVALDDDEPDEARHALEQLVVGSHRAEGLYVLTNSARTTSDPFPICQIWDDMAKVAWGDGGASWVVLLGDDVEIDCPFHYQAFYEAFAAIQRRPGIQRNNDELFFGSPWWNDTTFPGFPTFPAIGREHREIYGGLIPAMHRERFVNQDLDPYLQRLYLGVGAAPPVALAKLRNARGGEGGGAARYDRVPARGNWRDWVHEAEPPMRSYYLRLCRGGFSSEIQTLPRLVDVVVPTFRLDLAVLETIVQLEVPANWRTTFLVIVDNPKKLKRDHFGDASRLEETLRRGTTNNLRVRAQEENRGASAARNRGIEESAAQWLLFLDDDIHPKRDLLHRYEDALAARLKRKGDDTVGFAGPVVFPRDELPVSQAAVLASYLTYMFEYTVDQNRDTVPWAVTANLMVRRPSIRFDVAYAKTGGGEDVDFCLRLTAQHGGKIRPVPAATVEHPFWSANPLDLASHFFCWARGDSALLARFPEWTYRSWPNVPESLAVLVPLTVLLRGDSDLRAVVSLVAVEIAAFVVSDFVVDHIALGECHHRQAVVATPGGRVSGCQKNDEEEEAALLLLRQRLEGRYTPRELFLGIPLLANAYVLILECGRLTGHVSRGHWDSVGLRFDWHCGHIPLAPSRFRRRELLKFASSLLLLAAFTLPYPDSVDEWRQA